MPALHFLTDAGHEANAQLLIAGESARDFGHEGVPSIWGNRPGGAHDDIEFVVVQFERHGSVWPKVVAEGDRWAHGNGGCSRGGAGRAALRLALAGAISFCLASRDAW